MLHSFAHVDERSPFGIRLHGSERSPFGIKLHGATADVTRQRRRLTLDLGKRQPLEGVRIFVATHFLATMVDERLGLLALQQQHHAQQASESYLGFRLFPPLHSLVCFCVLQQ